VTEIETSLIAHEHLKLSLFLTFRHIFLNFFKVFKQAMDFELWQLREVAFGLASPVFFIAFVELYRINTTEVAS
jgi:hypothetical protein